MTTATPSNREDLERFRQTFRLTRGTAVPLPAVAFGSDPTSADELAMLIASGRKRATTSVLAAYSHAGEPLPRVDDHAVVVDGSSAPVCIIRTTVVDVRRYDEVDEQHARAEGEGDGTVADWQSAHADFLNEICAALGIPFTPSLLLVCERFDRVWPPDRLVPSRIRGRSGVGTG